MINKVGITTAFAATALFLGSAGAFAKTNTTNSAVQPQEFVKQAAQSDLAEQQLGALAVQKGTTGQVRDFGHLMEFDHSKADVEVKNLARNEHFQIPSTVTPEDRKQYDQLSKLSGQKFDDAYAQLMVQEHEKDVRQFRQEAVNGSDPSVKELAANTVPILQEHLRLAELMKHTESNNVGGK